MPTLESITTSLQEHPALMLYFSAPTCNVCHALKPKLIDAINSHFKDFEIISVDVSQEAEIAAHFNVFAIPTVLVFLEGGEFLRKSRHMSIDEVITQIKRPYEIMMS
jgi:thioredoxin 1